MEAEGEDLGCFSLTTLEAAATAATAEDRRRAAGLETGLKRSLAVDPRKAEEEEEGCGAFEARGDLSLGKEAERIALIEEAREAADMVARARGEGRKRRAMRPAREEEEEKGPIGFARRWGERGSVLI